MVHMTMPRGGFTAADLEAMPDDGNRYEIIDGSLIVTPSPVFRHQLAVTTLYRALFAQAPEGSVVLVAPFDVKISDTTVMQPDLLVAARSSFTEKNLPGPPLLAVEVLSPSTRHIDLMLKRSRYEAAGCAAYWVVDPQELSILAWELRAGAFVEVAHVTGGDVLELETPFSVRIVPSVLAD